MTLLTELSRLGLSNWLSLFKLILVEETHGGLTLLAPLRTIFQERKMIVTGRLYDIKRQIIQPNMSIWFVLREISGARR